MKFPFVTSVPRLDLQVASSVVCTKLVADFGAQAFFWHLET